MIKKSTYAKVLLKKINEYKSSNPSIRLKMSLTGYSIIRIDGHTEYKNGFDTDTILHIGIDPEKAEELVDVVEEFHSLPTSVKAVAI